MFTEFLLARWAGFDRSRSLEERRKALRAAIALREELGLPVTSAAARRYARKRHVKADPIARELDRVERAIGRSTARGGDPSAEPPTPKLLQMRRTWNTLWTRPPKPRSSRLP